jgi:hypothetical protein
MLPMFFFEISLKRISYFLFLFMEIIRRGQRKLVSKLLLLDMLLSRPSPLLLDLDSLVFCRDSEFSFPSTVTLSLLSQAKAVPVLFAIVTETGHVYIEEFTDALLTLDWNLPVGTPNISSTSLSSQQESSLNQKGVSRSLDDEENTDEPAPSISPIPVVARIEVTEYDCET